jgi:hypothetical protein
MTETTVKEMFTISVKKWSAKKYSIEKNLFPLLLSIYFNIIGIKFNK